MNNFFNSYKVSQGDYKTVIRRWFLIVPFLIFVPFHMFGQTPRYQTSSIVVVGLYSTLSNSRPVYSQIMFKNKEQLFELILGDTLNRNILLDSATLLHESEFGFRHLLQEDSTLNEKEYVKFMSMLVKMNKRFSKEKTITDGTKVIFISAVEIDATFCLLDTLTHPYTITNSYLSPSDFNSEYIVYLKNILKVKKRLKW